MVPLVWLNNLVGFLDKPLYCWLGFVVDNACPMWGFKTNWRVHVSVELKGLVVPTCDELRYCTLSTFV